MSHRRQVKERCVQIVASGRGPSSSSAGRFCGTSSPSYQLADLTYTKQTHPSCPQHPHQTANGVLRGIPSTIAACRTVDIVDAVPLQHRWTNLSPMMEVGLVMVRLPIRPCFSIELSVSRTDSSSSCGRQVSSRAGTCRRHYAVACWRTRGVQNKRIFRNVQLRWW